MDVGGIFVLMLFIILLMIAEGVRRNRLDDRRDEAQRIAHALGSRPSLKISPAPTGETPQRVVGGFNMACPVCGHDQTAWGLLTSTSGGNHTHSQLFALEGTGSKLPTVAFRCKRCGHVMLFADPPSSINRPEAL